MVASTPKPAKTTPKTTPSPSSPRQVNAGAIAAKRPEVAAALRRLHNI